MIRYEYEDLLGHVMSGIAEHLHVIYTKDKVCVKCVDYDGTLIDQVEVVGYLAPPRWNTTYKFKSTRFTIDGSQLQ